MTLEALRRLAFREISASRGQNGDNFVSAQGYCIADLLEAHELAKVTGHRDMRMVLRYYHPRAEDLARKIG